jgi:hypothetical protein
MTFSGGAEGLCPVACGATPGYILKPKRSAVIGAALFRCSSRPVRENGGMGDPVMRYDGRGFAGWSRDGWAAFPGLRP